ncbi:MAG: HIT family protein [Phycisphaerales bacterium]|jgi:histidine triad (HIT) family protein|nr:HIT family protein [Phycisphaerales bacterium]MBT7171580.1 HIT family protein [Phycisphaerales bacterium]
MKTDSDCLFCKIVAGEIPCCTILETDDALAFMDIGPIARGHVLLIPKTHAETLDALDSSAMAATARLLPSLVSAVQTATGCQGVNVLQNNGTVAGQIVPHVHFHLIPRVEGDAFTFNWPAGTYDEGEMESLAIKIRSRL